MFSALSITPKTHYKSGH